MHRGRWEEKEGASRDQSWFDYLVNPDSNYLKNIWKCPKIVCEKAEKNWKKVGKLKKNWKKEKNLKKWKKVFRKFQNMMSQNNDLKKHTYQVKQRHKK